MGENEVKAWDDITPNTHHNQAKMTREEEAKRRARIAENHKTYLAYRANEYQFLPTDTNQSQTTPND